MRFVISFLLCLNAWASPIQIYFEEDSVGARGLKQLLIMDYQIPEELIEVREIRNCEWLKESGKLKLCLKNNGDLSVVSVDKTFVNESLKIFRAP